MIKVVLFGNTGLANGVFRALVQSDSIELCAVYTRKLPGHFPYYEEEELWSLSEQQNIPTFTGQNVNSEVAVRKLSEIVPDYIIVSSFDQIIKKSVRDIPKLGIVNFHPSLLPKYRGPNPISWVLINNEKLTGLTIHYLTKAIDSGNILYQMKLEISDDDNLGSLYHNLSRLAESLSEKMVSDLTSNGLGQGTEQNEEQSSYYAKSNSFRYVDTQLSTEEILNKIKAFSPFPKSMIRIGNGDYFIEDVTVNQNEILKESYFSEQRKIYFLSKNDCTIELVVSPLI